MKPFFTKEEKAKKVAVKKTLLKSNLKEELKLQADEWKERPEKKLRKGFLGKVNSIQVKLIASILIPIVFIVILGIVSYNNASDALTKSYKESTYSSVVTTKNYFELATSAIELRLTQLKNYDSLKSYYSGTYKDNNGEQMLLYKEIKTYVQTTVFTDNLMSNIGMFCKKGDPFCSHGRFELPGQQLVEGFLQTEVGQQVKDAQGGFVWTGRHDFYDESLKIDASKPKIPYAFSVSSAFLGNGITQLGYIFGDLSYDLAVEQLRSMEVGEDSVFAAIAADGYEVSNRESSEALIATQDFIEKRLQMKIEKESWM